MVMALWGPSTGWLGGRQSRLLCPPSSIPVPSLPSPFPFSSPSVIPPLFLALLPSFSFLQLFLVPPFLHLSSLPLPAPSFLGFLHTLLAFLYPPVLCLLSSVFGSSLPSPFSPSSSFTTSSRVFRHCVRFLTLSYFRKNEKGP